MKRKCRCFEIDVHSWDEFDYYLSGGDKMIVFPVEVDIENGDIVLVNCKPKQTACCVNRVAKDQRMNEVYKIAYLNSIYPE